MTGGTGPAILACGVDQTNKINQTDQTQRRMMAYEREWRRERWSGPVDWMSMLFGAATVVLVYHGRWMGSWRRM
jgi:hypothetical protein